MLTGRLRGWGTTIFLASTPIWLPLVAAGLIAVFGAVCGSAYRTSFEHDGGCYPFQLIVSLVVSITDVMADTIGVILPKYHELVMRLMDAAKAY